jgi:hypothetical protein
VGVGAGVEVRVGGFVGIGVGCFLPVGEATTIGGLCDPMTSADASFNEHAVSTPAVRNKIQFFIILSFYPLFSKSPSSLT